MKRIFITKIENTLNTKVQRVFDIEGYEGEPIKPKSFIYYDIIPTHTYRIETRDGVYFIDNGEIVKDFKI